MALSEEMKNLVTQVKVGYVATATKSGVPNVSPKGTVMVVDDNTLAFGCVMSQRTISNLKENPNIAVAVVDPQARKGFQFKGTAVLENSGKIYEQISAGTAKMKLPPLRCIAKITVSEAIPVPPSRP